MSIRGKLSVVVLLLLLPLGMMTGLFINQSQKDMSFAQAEITGISWMRLTWSSLTAWANNPASADDTVLKDAKTLATPDLPTSVREAAGALALSGKLPSEAGALFRDLANAVGNDSNLLLDPDVDSYYVMNVIVTNMPDLLSRTAELDMLARNLASQPTLSEDSRATFIMGLGQIRADLDSIRSAIAVAAKNNPDGTVSDTLSAATSRLATSAAAFNAVVRQMAVAMRDDTSRKAIDLNKLSEARKVLVIASDRYWKAAADELEHLLGLRLAGFWLRVELMLGLALGVTVLALATAVLLSRSIVRSIASLDSHIRELGDADINAALAEARRSDEVGQLARAVAYFRDRTIDKLNEANSEEHRREIIQNERTALAGVADRLRVSVNSVVNAIEELTQNVGVAIDTVATNATTTCSELDQSLSRLDATNNDMNVVVSAVTELASSVSEIAQQTAASAQGAATARSQSEGAKALGIRLSEASERIGQVTTLISTIAQQTNLLALNATIEAARAGDAGKGFAVVAAEVKQLANQTASATEEIARQVEDIRNAAHEVTSSLGQITGSIEHMSTMSATIAGAVEQQSAATAEINASLERSTSANREVVVSLNRLPTLASGTEQAAGRLADMSVTLADQVQSLEREVDALVRDLTDQRHYVRKEADIVLTLDFADGSQRPLRLHDASRAGMRFTQAAGILPGAECRVNHPRLGQLPVKVIWSNDEVMGVQMLGRLLSDDEVDMLVGERLAA